MDWQLDEAFDLKGIGMMIGTTRIAGDDGDRCPSHAKDCPNALPSKVDQQEREGAGQTREQWLQANRQAIGQYNERVQEHGVFSDGVRYF